MLPVSLIRVSENNLSILPLLSRNPGLSDYWQNTDISAKNLIPRFVLKFFGHRILLNARYVKKIGTQVIFCLFVIL